VVQDNAEVLRGKRLLVRTDNVVSMFVIRKQASMNAELNDMYKRLATILRDYEIELAVVHIPGKENGLADALSRWHREFDDQDWQLDRKQFERIDKMAGPFEIDACCDLAGHNTHCEKFWTAVDDCTEQQWRGKRVYCNPPYNDCLRILRHALSEWSKQPYSTALTFVLPKWTWSSWYHLADHFTCLLTYPKASKLFTSPDWREINAGADTSTRCFRGVTDWPVVVWHKPPLRKQKNL
jgi:hypothetical protein